MLLESCFCSGRLFEINEGEVVDMEVLIGEISENFCAYLLIEKEGELYNRNNKGVRITCF